MQGLTMYAMANAGTLPPGYWGTLDAIGNADALLPLLGVEKTTVFPFISSQGGKLFRCPSQSTLRSNDVPQYQTSTDRIHMGFVYVGGDGGGGNSGSFWKGYAHYSISPWYENYLDPALPGPVTKLTSRKNASEVGLVGDRISEVANSLLAWSDVRGDVTVNHVRNGLCIGGNIGYVDGHVAWVNYPDTSLRVFAYGVYHNNRFRY